MLSNSSVYTANLFDFCLIGRRDCGNNNNNKGK